MSDIQFTDEQSTIIALAVKGDNLLVTGPAGAGKSMLLRHLNDLFNKSSKDLFSWRQFPKFAIVASTGIAAVNIGGVTIHSWAGIGLAEQEKELLAKHVLSGRPEVIERIRATETLAIDEVSMLSAALIEKLDHVFSRVRGDPRPFGGIQMILFGDFLQLPPVEKGGKKKRSGFCFESEAWQRANIKQCFLTKIFRQDDEKFQEALSDIRRGEQSKMAKMLLYACASRSDEDPSLKPVILHSHNNGADAINAAELAKIEAEPKTFYAADEGSPYGVQLLEKNCIAPTVLEAKVGAQVMLLTNLDVESGLANGTIGKIVRWSEYGDNPVVEFANGMTVEIARHQWEVKQDDEIIAKRSQIPLRLAYAITIHKSQGMQFDKLQVYISKCFEYGQVYVALSRAKNHKGLFVDTKGYHTIKAHPLALWFYGYIDEEEVENRGFSIPTYEPDEPEPQQGNLFE